jgi:putative acetyltransferase
LKETALRRLATPADRDAVFAIYSHPEVTPYLTYEPMSPQAFVPVYDELLASGSFHVWTEGGEVAGFYRATRHPGRVNHVVLLGTLAVDPRRHGQGIARAMLDDAVSHLRAQGVRRLELYAEADNPRALRFYGKLGFVHEGTLRQFYKRAHQAHYVDEWVMGLLLA